MAASLTRYVNNCLPKKFNYTKLLQTQDNTIRCSRFLKTEAELLEGASLEDRTEQIEDEDNGLEKRRNKSRLLPQHRRMLYEEPPYSSPVAWHQHTVKYKRALYGRYGEKSGVNPGIMWPTRELLAQAKEYEAVVHSKTVREMMIESEKRKKEESDEIKAREEDILKKIAKLDQWKNELRTKIAKKLSDAQAAKERKDRLVEEVRRHFGFKVDPRDERFKEMLEQKEKEDKKSLKEAKKKAREDKMLSKLALKSKSSESKDNPSDDSLH